MREAGARGRLPILKSRAQRPGIEIFGKHLILLGIFAHFVLVLSRF